LESLLCVVPTQPINASRQERNPALSHKTKETYGLYISKPNEKITNGHLKKSIVIARLPIIEKQTIGPYHERPKRARETHEKFVAIDPGVRTPFVMYSPTEGVTEIGKNDAQRLGLHADRLSSQRDILNNSTSKRKKRKAKRLDGAIARISRKIKNLRNELHKKTVNHLVQNYVVIITEFDVKNMVKRD